MDQGCALRTRAGTGDRGAIGHDQGRADQGDAQHLTLLGAMSCA
jgi:hypothetical protein